jgi:hypothetical protein
MTDLDALILSLPARNSTARMRAWRALREAGCGVLRDGVYVVPAGSPTSGALAEIEAEIRRSGGMAMRVELHLKGDEQRSLLPRLFDRGPQYEQLLGRVKSVRAQFRRLGPRKAKTALDRLQRELEKLVQIDFFPGAARTQATDALSTLAREYHETYAAQGEPRVSHRKLRPADRSEYQGRIWATRKDPWVDRLASAWLIGRFIDPKPKFVWLDRPSSLPRKAVGYDYDGAEFTHVGNKVTFEVLMERFKLDKDNALVTIGECVHYLDVGGAAVGDAPGLETVLKGVKERASSDDTMLAEAMRIFDHVYSAHAKRKA